MSHESRPMKIETPRTDKFASEPATDQTLTGICKEWADFARQLETELSAALGERDEAREALKRASGYELDEYKAMLKELRGQYWYDCSEHGRVAATIKGCCSECNKDDISMPFSGSMERKI